MPYTFTIDGDGTHLICDQGCDMVLANDRTVAEAAVIAETHTVNHLLYGPRPDGR